MDFEKAASKIAAKYSKPSEDKAASDDKEVQNVRGADEKGSLGRAALAAMKHGDGEAFEEAVCQIMEKHRGSY